MLLNWAKDTTFQGAWGEEGGRGDGGWETERLGGWKLTTILKHANATGRNRKEAKYINNWAADPAENPTQEYYLPFSPQILNMTKKKNKKK